MTWFKVDDGFAFHPKALAAGNLALGLWVRAGAYSSAHLTEGFIRKDIVASLGTVAAARKLVDAGLWDLVDGGYRFHQWEQRNPSRDDVESEREAARLRVAAARKAKREKAATAGEMPPPDDVPPPGDEDENGSVFGECSGEHTCDCSGHVRQKFENSSPYPDPTRPDPARSTSLGGVEREVEVDLDLPVPADELAALRLANAPYADPSEYVA